jgi:hypothetical protein
MHECPLVLWQRGREMRSCSEPVGFAALNSNPRQVFDLLGD